MEHYSTEARLAGLTGRLRRGCNYLHFREIMLDMDEENLGLERTWHGCCVWIPSAGAGEHKGRVGVEGKVVRTVSEHLPKVSSLSCHTLLLKVYFENALSLPLLFVCFFTDDW